MSLRGGVDGNILVHGGPAACCHGDASSLPLSNTGRFTSQKGLPPVLHRNQLPVPQWPRDGVLHRGVGSAS